MSVKEFGALRKMSTSLDSNNNVSYELPVGDQLIPLNPLIGREISLHFNGQICCQHCGRKTKKSYSQGFCYVCMQKLAQCDMCIMKPETCHYHLGTCREPEWGEQFCFKDHIVYLANSSGIKVGITRLTQLPTRWIDQGATQAIPIFRVDNRLLSGLVETALKEFVADKTNWRAMLKGMASPVDLTLKAEELKPQIAEKLKDFALTYGENAIEALSLPVVDINYPVEEYPVKVTSFNFDKTPSVSGVLKGIKGQYLIFDTGVINIRKFTSYQINLETH